MREFNRISEIIANLHMLWINYPDMRLGQLLENFVFTNPKVDMFYQEDDITNDKIQEAWQNLL